MTLLRPSHSLLALAACCLASCGGEPEVLGPPVAEVTYDISYSEDLRKNPTFGDILPRTLYSIYDTANVKFTLRGPLGLGGVDIVLSHEEDFVSFMIEDLKLLLTMGNFEDATGDIDDKLGHRLTDGLIFTPVNTITDIEGYPSRMLKIGTREHLDEDVAIDAFYVPTQPTNGQEVEADKLNLHNIGLLTAINVKRDETAIMIVINKLKPLETVDSLEFKRPEGFLETNRHDLEDIIELVVLANRDKEE